MGNGLRFDGSCGAGHGVTVKPAGGLAPIRQVAPLKDGDQ
jgi:hypothetical protein